ncbi:MAG: hypothetical protein ACFFGZ_13900 [Candidatus Thorarchaeota archaeon]
MADIADNFGFELLIFRLCNDLVSRKGLVNKIGDIFCLEDFAVDEGWRGEVPAISKYSNEIFPLSACRLLKILQMELTGRGD